MLRHFVFLKYLEGTHQQHISHFCEKMFALCDSLPEVLKLEIGKDELRDSRSWDLVLIMEFPSLESLRAYQKHPLHQAIMKFNDPHVANIASIDFEKLLRMKGKI